VLRDFFKDKTWGFWVAMLSIAITFIVISQKPPVGHYVSFTQPAVELWKGANPYGINYPGGHGHFHYSPSCALFFFGLFAFLPPLVGYLLYMAAEIALWVYALARLLRALKAQSLFDTAKMPWPNLFWLMFSSEVVGSILTQKMEIMIVALAFLSLALLLEGGKNFWAGALLGVGIAFNFQPLPIAGLAALVGAVALRDWRFPAGVLTSAAGVTAASVAVLGWDFYQTVARTWYFSTEEFTSQSWLAFHHIWHPVRYFTGSVPSFYAAMRAGAGVGISLAVFLVWWLNATRLPRNLRSKYGWVAAFGMGSAFSVLFFPLSQSNAYAVYAPLIPAVWIFSRFLNLPQWALGSIAITAYFITSITYSDLVPRPVYRFCFDSGLKPLGVLILLGVLLASMVATTRSQFSARYPQN
jgi:hypothetical protein